MTFFQGLVLFFGGGGLLFAPVSYLMRRCGIFHENPKKTKAFRPLASPFIPEEIDGVVLNTL